MNKILLIGLNSRFSHPNLALYYLRNYTADLDYQIKIMEFTIRQNSDEIIKEITKWHTDMICFSVYIWNVEKIKHILPMIKKNIPECKLLLGGPEVSYNPDEWLENFKEIDFIITGPGEEGFRNLLMRGLNSESKKISKANPHFSEIPFPYSDEDLKNFKNKNIYYEASRGCPYKCAYCVSSREDQKLEFKNIETVKEELGKILIHKPGIIKFLDRTFNSKKSFYRPFWEFLIEEYPRHGTKFHFEIHPGLLDEDDFKLLSNCPGNLFQFEVGIQSTCDSALNAIDRSHEWKNIEPMVRKIIEMENIHIHTDLIAGLPFEDMGSFKKSFNDIYSLKAGHFQLGILKILKGTKIYDDADLYDIKYSAIAPYMIKSNKWLSESELNRIFIISQLIDTLYNTHKFSSTLAGLEKIYGAPYNLFDSLASFIITNYSGSRTKIWEESARRILKFVETFNPKEEDFFRDSLVWDWCMNARLHYYPGFLSSGENKKIRKQVVKFFSRFMDGEKILFDGIFFTLKDLKKSLYFKPLTERFMEEYTCGKNMALFLPGKKMVYFDL